MPLNHLRNTLPAWRTRPSGPRCRGGASSLLRLAQPSTPRLPEPRGLSEWIKRAAGALQASADMASGAAASEFGANPV